MKIIEKVLDVSELFPPEPLERAQEAVYQLERGQYLLLKHRREPCLLYPLLDEEGFRHYTRETEAGTVEVFICRGDDADTIEFLRSKKGLKI